MKRGVLKILFVLLFISPVGYFPEGGSAAAAVYAGDVSHDGLTDLRDVILSLQVLSGRVPTSPVHADADVDSDERIGLAEAVTAQRVVARQPVGWAVFTDWDETAVRKVLQTFAYGGHPTDDQVTQWADMNPEDAIREMLTFSPFNERLSPPDIDSLIEHVNGTLESLADFFSTASADNPFTDEDDRGNYNKRQWRGPRYTWLMAMRARGLNSFYHRIGFWETNYHMSANHEAGVYPFPMIRHYDNIMLAHAEDLPYQQVMARGALNAAIAYQYGHNHNVWIEGEFRGNDDFAREFHQLFFCNLGEYDHDYHESVSIEHTALALTGIRANYHPSDEGGPDVEACFSSDVHHVEPVEILHATITGANAKEKIENLAEVAIDHPESQANLPVMIVETLADDNLTPEKKTALRWIWQAMPEKSLLEFLRTYAISTLFHSPDRIKYHTSFDKHLFIHNQMLLANQELYDDINGIQRLLSEDDVLPFRPLHNVFGHQTGDEAYNSPTIFKNHYNESTDWYWYYERLSYGDSGYSRQWHTVIPPNQYGLYMVKDVARWLWQRFVADGWKNYSVLEKAHLYALLSTGHDLGYYLHDTLPTAPDPDTVYYEEDLSDPNAPASIMVQNAGNSYIALNSPDPDTRETANKYVQRAIAFIAATPYTFLEEGR